MTDSTAPLLILGCGFTGMAAARIALAHGRPVIATTRRPEHAAELTRAGIVAHTSETIGEDFVRDRAREGAQVLVTFPPDGETDARVAAALPDGCRCVYVSTTGVYGNRSGRIDASTPVDLASERAAQRFAAEESWRARGAVVLRAAGIYGPWRGLHRRVAAGTFRLTEDGRSVVSRIHVDDLAALCLAALDRGVAGSTFPVADDEPVPQVEVVRWLVAKLGVAMPASASREDVHETLRHDRSIDGREVQRALGVTLRFPSWREGYDQCFAVEGGALSA
ncbi:MAG: hypothetical protein U0326_11475 [Polyangiales bacterium]